MLPKSRVVIHCTHMNTDKFSVRVDRSTKSRLEKLAKSTGRSRSFLAAEAITAYLDTNEWQISGITAALSPLDRGKASPTSSSAVGSALGRHAKSAPLLGVYDAPMVSRIDPRPPRPARPSPSMIRPPQSAS